MMMMMMRRMRIRMRMRMRMRMIWILMEYPTEWWKIVTASVPESSTSRSACGLWNPVKPLRNVKPLHVLALPTKSLVDWPIWLMTPACVMLVIRLEAPWTTGPTAHHWGCKRLSLVNLGKTVSYLNWLDYIWPLTPRSIFSVKVSVGLLRLYGIIWIDSRQVTSTSSIHRAVRVSQHRVSVSKP
jgi:hypothetical protein